MTKTEMVAKLATAGKITKRQAETIFSAFVDSIKESLQKNERVALPGLGSFTCVERKARKGRNPRTGAEIKIPARKAVKFSTSSGLSKNLNGTKKAAAKAAPKKKK
ncbi:MAG: DNA-binding protein HRL53 [Syntrophorhabdaceae bacterium PtaU1.Bin034]|jgi:DNA-binding protein HU-beta|nr:MAG: DNA-binding protein HRL53 [Syntrophorhabdaceae bacterium PtaU1.Bin034]